MIVITDALSHDNPFIVASQIKAMNVEIFAVSVGIQSNKTVLQSVVSQPVNKHLFSSKDSLENILNAVKEGSCKSIIQFLLFLQLFLNFILSEYLQN